MNADAEHQNLRVPGPTPVPDAVARAGARPMVNHRGPEFAASMAAVTAGLKPFFGTQQEPLLLTGSGTGALEAAVVNMLSPGDRVLAVTIGMFGDRFAAIADAFGADVVRLHAEWGRAVSAEAVMDALDEFPGVKAVFLTHNETSTGVTNDVSAIAIPIRDAYAQDAPLVLVDGVSSIGALPFEMDDWGVDVAVSGSQKAWMVPPGLAMVAVSEKAWRAHALARMPRYYWDFTKARSSAEKRVTPFTPAVGIIRALEESLKLMHQEGREEVFARHRRLGAAFRHSFAGMGLELFADQAVASDTVTAVRVPTGVEAGALLREVRKSGVVLAPGQDVLKGQIFRIGHLGWIHDDDVTVVIDALQSALDKVERSPQTVVTGLSQTL